MVTEPSNATIYIDTATTGGMAAGPLDRLRLTEALVLIDRALAADPGNPAFLDSRGWALLKLGRVADAEAPLRSAADALRSSSVIQSHYADVLAALGKRGEAADRLELALAGDGIDVDRAALERRLRQLGRKTP